jgi:hypothetical protein
VVFLINDLHPDGMRIVVPWEAMELGESVFVPCINVDSCRKQLAGISARLGVTLTSRKRIENHILGLRVWRTT